MLFCGLLVLPFLLVRFVPISDLPQQVAQIRLLGEAWQDPGGPYAIQWWHPNRLSYLFLGLVWLLVPPLAVGRVTMLLVGLCWVGAIHGLAASRGRPSLGALFASLLFFNHTMYWGFYNFLLGWPCFVLWFLLLSDKKEAPPSSDKKEAPPPWKTLLLTLTVAWLLYFAHVLWFLAGMAWLVGRQIVMRQKWRLFLLRLCATVPVGILVLVWYPTLQRGGFTSKTIWLTLPWERLSPYWLTNAAFGGIRGSLELVFFLFFLLWIVAALLQHRQRLQEVIDAELLWAGLMFLLFALFLPHKQSNTIFLESRWMPVALLLFVPGLPLPRLRPFLQKLLVSTAVVIFVLTTLLVWLQAEGTHFTGLPQSLKKLPSRPQLLGLEFVRKSPSFKHQPFLQVFAYAQVTKGGTLNFSFADFASSFVVYRPQRPLPWTPGLEWFPRRIQPTDFPHFTHVLLNGPKSIHRLFTQKAPLVPLTHRGTWRLYAVKKRATSRPSQK